MNSQAELYLSKYNTALANIQALTEQNKTNQKAWNEKETNYKHAQKKMRELCESILAKDRSEMVLGEEYSWDKLPIEKLIDKSAQSFKTYNESRSALMGQIMDTAELRREQIESLEDQIKQFMLGGNQGDLSTAQEIIARQEKEALEEQGKSNLPNKIKDVVNAGNVELIVEDADDIQVEGEKRLISEMAEINEQMKVTSASIPIVQSTNRKSMIEDAKDAAMKAHMVDLSAFENRVTDVMWVILQTIGEQGLSKYPDIEAYILNNNFDYKKNRIRLAAQELYRMGAVSQEPMSLPLTPKIFVYRLSDIGIRLYKMHFEKNPVISEVEKIIAEHDNAEHGYGIVDVEKILRDSGVYDNISSFNRKKAIDVGDGLKYIPDLICECKRFKDYIEYERGTHTQTDFSAKCNKMVKVTRFVNIVVPNKTVMMKKVKPKIDAWIESRGVESLKNIKIRLTTALALKDKNPQLDEAWQVIYEPKKGVEPVKCPD